MILPKVTLKTDECTQVRLLEIVKDAILHAHKCAIDCATDTYIKDVTAGLQAFTRDLKSQVASINVEVYADEALNTASALGAGKAYWNICFTDVPPGEQSIFSMEVASQWVTEVRSPKEAAQ